VQPVIKILYIKIPTAREGMKERSMLFGETLPVSPEKILLPDPLVYRNRTSFENSPSFISLYILFSVN